MRTKALAALMHRPRINLAPPTIKRTIHSSKKQKQPTPGLSMQHQQAASKECAGGTSSIVPKPTKSQLKVLFTASAVPMIGFGFMDNIVMIQAGQFIDNTLGVSLGLATMTAAAAGQVVSDVSGVIFGGSLERFLHRYNLIKPTTLTAAQRGLTVCRNVSLLGAVCGVALGCGLGASCLLFMDLEARERAERALQLRAVLNDMMMETASSREGALSNCETCIIHLAHMSTAEQFSTQHEKLHQGKTKLEFLPSLTSLDNDKGQGKADNVVVSLAVRAAQSGQPMLSENDNVLCAPILSRENKGEVVAVLEFNSGSNRGFTTEDVNAAKVLARHIAIFMHRLGKE